MCISCAYTCIGGVRICSLSTCPGPLKNTARARMRPRKHARETEACHFVLSLGGPRPNLGLHRSLSRNQLLPGPALWPGLEKGHSGSARVAFPQFDTTRGFVGLGAVCTVAWRKSGDCCKVEMLIFLCCH